MTFPPIEFFSTWYQRQWAVVVSWQVGRWSFVSLSVIIMKEVATVLQVNWWPVGCVLGLGGLIVVFWDLLVWIGNYFPQLWFYQVRRSDGIQCCRSNWPGLCLLCSYQPLCVFSQKSWFGLFFFHKFSNFTSPPPSPLAIQQLHDDSMRKWRHSSPLCCAIWFSAGDWLSWHLCCWLLSTSSSLLSLLDSLAWWYWV